jgi:succinyl-diaminopimelate desuccinylase
MPQADLQRLQRMICEWVDENRATGLRLLQDLVRTPSYSGREGTADDASSVVGKITRALAGRGTEVTTQLVRPGSENVIETLCGDGDRVFVLEAHTDVVPEGDATLWFGRDAFSGAEGRVEYLGNQRVRLRQGDESYEATIRERMDRTWQKRSERERNVVFGRGSFDNKGAVASAILAQGALAHGMASVAASLDGSVIACYAVDEEESGSGVKAFACGPDSWLGRNGHLAGPVSVDGMLEHISGVALEGSYGWTPIVGHRAAVQLSIQTRGRSAHAATPHMGVNAVVQMSQLLLALEAGTPQIVSGLLPALEPALLGPPTLAIGTTIVGGGVRSVMMGPEGPAVDRAGVNAIPNWCEATVDIRYPPSYRLDPEATAQFVLTTVRDYLQRTIDPDGWSYTVDLLDWSPGVALARSLKAAAQLPLVQQARSRAEQILGYQPDLETAPGGTDATFMVNLGRIPTLVEFGPAGGLSHDVNEFVEVDDVISGAKILALMALDVLGVK